jgi:hypothetical protein
MVAQFPSSQQSRAIYSSMVGQFLTYQFIWVAAKWFMPRVLVHA